jgi:hypothetical protein
LTRYLVLRVGQTVPVVIAALLAAFLLLKVVPGDPARAIAGPRATEEAVAAIREDLGLDDALPTQFARYIGRVVHGDLGTTTTGNVEVSTLIRENGVVTLWLVSAGVYLVCEAGLRVVYARLVRRAAVVAPLVNPKYTRTPKGYASAVPLSLIAAMLRQAGQPDATDDDAIAVVAELISGLGPRASRAGGPTSIKWVKGLISLPGWLSLPKEDAFPRPNPFDK